MVCLLLRPGAPCGKISLPHGKEDVVIPREQLRQYVIDAILDNQEDGARAIPDLVTITDNFCPIGDLDGFDSYSAMETTLELSERLGCEIDERIFLTRVGDRRATIGEIVEHVYRLINAQEAHSDG